MVIGLENRNTGFRLSVGFVIYGNNLKEQFKMISILVNLTIGFKKTDNSTSFKRFQVSLNKLCHSEVSGPPQQQGADDGRAAPGP